MHERLGRHQDRILLAVVVAPCVSLCLVMLGFAFYAHPDLIVAPVTGLAFVAFAASH